MRCIRLAAPSRALPTPLPAFVPSQFSSVVSSAGVAMSWCPLLLHLLRRDLCLPVSQIVAPVLVPFGSRPFALDALPLLLPLPEVSSSCLRPQLVECRRYLRVPR